MLEGRFPTILVKGEVSNLRNPSSGHLYFTLKDEDACLDAVLFRTEARRLRFDVRNGLSLVARGRLVVYEPKGGYQLVCDSVEPLGAGALQVAFEQLKERLQQEGLFEAVAQAKAPLPAPPHRRGHQSERRRGPRLPPRAAPALSQPPRADRPCPRAGRGRGAGDRAGHRTGCPAAAGGRGGGGARRRQHRGPLGLQRGGGGPRALRLPGAHGERRRTRGGLHHRGLLRRRTRAHAYRRRRADRAGEGRIVRGRGSAPRPAGARVAFAARAQAGAAGEGARAHRGPAAADRGAPAAPRSAAPARRRSRPRGALFAGRAPAQGRRAAWRRSILASGCTGWTAR